MTATMPSIRSTVHDDTSRHDRFAVALALVVELVIEPVAKAPFELAVPVSWTFDVVLLLESEVGSEVLVTFITGGRLDCDGIKLVVRRGFDVVVRMVASGPIVIGTPMTAQSSATTEKVSIFGEYGVQAINPR